VATPPFAKGGRGGFKPRPNHPKNHFKHGFRFFQYLQVVKTQYVQSQSFEIRIPPPITHQPRRLEMLRSIHFHDKFRSRRMKIHDVLSKRLLLVKLYAKNLFATQT